MELARESGSGPGLTRSATSSQSTTRGSSQSLGSEKGSCDSLLNSKKREVVLLHHSKECRELLTLKSNVYHSRSNQSSSNSLVGQDDSEFFGIQATPTRNEARSLTEAGKGLRFFKKGEYFDALCRFNQAANIFQIAVLVPSLKRTNERVFHLVIDSILCQTLCYLKLQQSYHDSVLPMLNSILLVEPSNKEALALRDLTYLRLGQLPLSYPIHPL